MAQIDSPRPRSAPSNGGIRRARPPRGLENNVILQPRACCSTAPPEKKKKKPSCTSNIKAYASLPLRARASSYDSTWSTSGSETCLRFAPSLKTSVSISSASQPRSGQHKSSFFSEGRPMEFKKRSQSRREISDQRERTLVINHVNMLLVLGQSPYRVDVLVPDPFPA